MSSDLQVSLLHRILQTPVHEERVRYLNPDAHAVTDLLDLGPRTGRSSPRCTVDSNGNELVTQYASEPPTRGRARPGQGIGPTRKG